uniref:Transthyretin-like protein 52 n=1 Tax=Steinernema glaseri TaxID=37863 RepID=A0A1I7YQI8_9BILA
MSPLLVLFLVALASVGTSANTRCYKVIGNVTCSTKPLDGRVEIQLFDSDGLPWESDDLMGRTWANKDGTFQVEGCGNDFGPYNDPDPYLKFTHTCADDAALYGDPNAVVHSTKLISETYLPHVITLGEVDLRALEVVE